MDPRSLKFPPTVLELFADKTYLMQGVNERSGTWSNLNDGRIKLTETLGSPKIGEIKGDTLILPDYFLRLNASGLDQVIFKKIK